MKKKFLSMVAFVCVIICSAVLLVGCSESPQTFTSSNGVSIELTNKFRQSTQSGFDLCASTRKVAVLISHESYALLEVNHYTPSTMTAEDYLKKVRTANIVISSTAPVIDAEHNITYFTYVNAVQGKQYFYFAVAKKGTDAFWLCNIACLKGQEENLIELFKDWSSTLLVP